MIPKATAPQPSSGCPLPLPDLPEPPEEATRYALDVLAQQIERIRSAPNGHQEATLNSAAYHLGQLVGARAIGAEEVRAGLEAAGMAMESYDPRTPWTSGFIAYKVLRSLTQGAANPDPIRDPIAAMVQRSAERGTVAIPVPPTGSDHPPFSDMGNGERFAGRWSDQVRYCNELASTELGGWMVWNRCYWESDETLAIQEMAKETARAIALETPPVTDDDKIDKAGKITPGKDHTAAWALKSEDGSRVRRMIDMARSIPPIPARANEFDQHPYLLNVLNGTLDLYDQELIDADRTHLLTQCAPVAYDPDARCPRWDQFLFDCMGGVERLVDFLQTWTGYSLTGDISEQKMLLHYGEGANGKSTFLDVLATLKGSYAAVASPATFMVSERGESADAARPDLAALRGARMVQAIETNQRQSINESLIKSITGGDSITARHLYSKPFTFKPEFKLTLATNLLPRISGQDHGMWRRLLANKWLVSFGTEGAPPIDLHLKGKLLEELPGILNWALEGCARWIEKGLSIPPEITANTADYKEASDDLGLFVEECLVDAPDLTIPQAELYSVYELWSNAGRPLGKRTFLEKIPRHREKNGEEYSPGIAKVKVRGMRLWKGIAYSTTGAEIATRLQFRGLH